MSSEEFSLIWNEHQSMVVGVFEKLLDSGSLVDCTIAAEGQYMKAHKLVLSACSPYFEMLFNQENEKNPIVILKDIKFQELKAIIDFMYRGKVNISRDRLDCFIDASQSLQIKGLDDDLKQNDVHRRLSEFVHSTEGGPVSPVPKRRRGSYPAADGENIDSFSYGIESIKDGNICESLPQQPVTESSPHSPQPEITKVNNSSESLPHHPAEENPPCSLQPVLPPCSVSDEPQTMPLQSSAQEEMCSAEAQSSSLFVQPAENDIKIDPEQMQELLEPEAVYLIEPKIEDYEEGMQQLDTTNMNGERTTGDVMNHEDNNPLCLGEVAACMEVDQLSSAERRSASIPASKKAPSASGSTTKTATGKRATKAPEFPIPTLNTPFVAPPYARSTSDERLPGVAAQDVHPETEAGKPPIVCGECGKEFSRRSNFVQHKLTHTGERPFKCEDCGSAFNRKANLKKHRRIHTGERPYSCAECGETFSQLPHFKHHQRKHTGERPFKCECGETFSHRRRLKLHRRKHAVDQEASST